MIDLSGELKRAIWDVLVTECGADPRAWGDFWHHFPQCREYRFQGSLGFGGKVWSTHGSRVDVTCYPEDETRERRAAIDRANVALAELLAPAVEQP